MMDIATRVWDHKWKIDPIVRSLIDTDFYKLLMCQSIFRNKPDTNVVFSLINRSTKVRLADIIDEGELREQLDHVRTLSLARGESTWLRGNTFYGKRQMFRSDFMEWFEGMRLPAYHLEKRDGQFELTFEGAWPEVMLWEIPALAVLMELRSRAVLNDMGKFELQVLYARAMTRAWEKIERLRKIMLDGLDVTKADRDAFLARFGMLFQGGALFDSLKVWENVAFRLLRGAKALPKAEAREIAIEKLRRVGLKPETADLFPAELSGGMQKRVGLARAIAAEPEIIFFDEPTTGLDPIMAGVINDLIREIVVEMGATAMTITHDMSSVRAIADTVAMLHGGVIRWTGPVSEMDATPDPYVQQFIHGKADGPIESVR